MKKLLSLLLALVLLCACAAGCSKPSENGTEPTQPDFDDSPILSSEHYEIGADEFQYFLAFTFSNFQSQYGSYTSAMGLDVEAPLRDQQFAAGQAEEGYTWFDYLAEGAADTLANYLALAEDAIAKGVTLSEEEQKEIDDELAAIEGRAAEAGYPSKDEYIKAQFGSLISMDTLKTCFNLYYLADKHHRALYNSATFTDEDLETYAEENKADIYKADFMYLRVGTEPTEDMSEAELAANLDAAKTRAIAINNAISDKASFISEAEKYFREAYTVVATEEEADSEKGLYTEEQIKEMAQGCENTAVSYNVSAQGGKWVFDEARTAGEHYILEDPETGCCEIYLLLKPNYRIEEKTVDVSHILLDSDTYGDLAKAEAKANEVYDLWKSGEATEESFALLALEYSSDTGSASNGGLYQAVLPGQMVTEFNDWCFDPERKPGDTDIVKTEYGYHIMYFVDGGTPYWKYTAQNGLRDSAYDKLYAEIEKTYPVEKNLDLIDNVPDLN